jgi:predicted ABC-type ATPase
MNAPAPRAIIIGGPNGAGKTTAAPQLLRGPFDVNELVNADTIAVGLSAFRPEDVAGQAGRLMLQRLDDLAAQRASFAFESTLAGRTYVQRLNRLISQGYEIHLVFLWLPSADLAVARVLERVRRGGHSVPEQEVRRRYRAGLVNFFSLYRPLATSWRLYDNTESMPRLVASGSGSVSRTVEDPATWVMIERESANE